MFNVQVEVKRSRHSRWKSCITTAAYMKNTPFGLPRAKTCRGTHQAGLRPSS